MARKGFLVPIGTAVAALLSTTVQAVVNTADVQKLTDDAVRTSPSATPSNNDRVIQELTYMTQSEVHTLMLRQSSTGVLYAGHGSHSSHGSHGSHGSHRSGY